MTPEWSVSLSDINAILLRCKNCGTTLSYPLREWERVPSTCVNCLNVRSDGTLSQTPLECKILDNFRQALVEALKAAPELRVEIRFGLDSTRG